MDEFRDTFKRYIPRSELEALKKELVEQVAPAPENDQSVPQVTPPVTALPASNTSVNAPDLENQKSKIKNSPEHCLQCGNPLPPAPLGSPRPYTHCQSCGTPISGLPGTSLREQCSQCGTLQPLHGYNAFRDRNACPQCRANLPPLDPNSPVPWLPPSNGSSN